MDLEQENKYGDNGEELINNVVANIFSFDNARRQRMLDGFYFQDAVFISPLLCVKGNYNIKNVFLLWKALNQQEPSIDNVCFDGQTCVVYMTQTLRPRLFPWVSLQIPVITTLYFKETDLDSGLWKIYQHEETWTIEGLLESVPLLSRWYDYVIRTMAGKVLVFSGQMLTSANDTAQLLNSRSQEIEDATRKLAQENAASWKSTSFYDDSDYNRKSNSDLE
ncbi:uncharacterized protein BX664DRAFT_330644 [Halteromyces radiatus]|uniref:uncharacterized protein n=1 Tax=Halteromyces radiatus TaxID=101107 RepID=UPI002220037A|nr:uncharacterized protein BX664DRAFT_330644 [Halteromyces radiatus]KAI8093815.1 hypothetical protein BX664DRAFT_330644 [Halteromyces radiatus]